PSESMKSIRCLTTPLHFFSLGAAAIIAVALASPAVAQSDNDTAGSPDSLPTHLQQSVNVMVELSDAPAAVAYATTVKQAQSQYDAQRNYALQHPKLKSSQTFLKKTVTSIQISSAATSQIQSTVSKIDQAQQ